jgi:hypothetical protein
MTGSTHAPSGGRCTAGGRRTGGAVEARALVGSEPRHVLAVGGVGADVVGPHLALTVLDGIDGLHRGKRSSLGQHTTRTHGSSTPASRARPPAGRAHPGPDDGPRNGDPGFAIAFKEPVVLDEPRRLITCWSPPPAEGYKISVGSSQMVVVSDAGGLVRGRDARGLPSCAPPPGRSVAWPQAARDHGHGSQRR